MEKEKEERSSPPTSTISSSWEGAYWKIVSLFCFAIINGIVRYSSGGVPGLNSDPLPVSVIGFFQNLFGVCFLFPWLKIGVKDLGAHPNSSFLHFIRVATGVAGVYLWYLSLRFLPIAEAVALSFSSDIFSVIGASVLLQERITSQRLAAILIGLFGVFVISRPDIPLRGGDHPIGLLALLPLSSQIALALNKLLTRKLAKSGESPVSLATLLLLFMAPASLLPAIFDWTVPRISHWPWLLLLGLLAAGAHLSFCKAYQLAEVTFLMPVSFLKFLLSTAVGYFAFSESPTRWSLWIGIGIIFASILLLKVSFPAFGQNISRKGQNTKS